jgi:hypothetical protein
MMLSLNDALMTGRVQEFIAQEEARGVSRRALRKMDRALARALAQRGAKAGASPDSCPRRKPIDAAYS